MPRVVVLLFVLTVLTLASGSSTVCTVRSTPGADFPTVQSALYGCNGGVGSIELHLGNETFHQNLVFPEALTNVTFISDSYANTPHKPDEPFLCAKNCSELLLSSTWVNETLIRLGPSIVAALNCSSYGSFPLPNDCVVLDSLALGCPMNTSNVNCTSDPMLLSRIVGAAHQVLNASTQLSFYGVWFDGAGTDQSLFFPPLVNNNLTLDRCLVSEPERDELAVHCFAFPPK